MSSKKDKKQRRKKKNVIEMYAKRKLKVITVQTLLLQY